MSARRLPASTALRWLAMLCAVVLPMSLVPASADNQVAGPTPTPVTYPQFGVVTATSAMDVRDCPDEACQVLFSIPLGESIRITGSATNGWLPISRDGAPGWAIRWFVRIGEAPRPVFTGGEPGCKRVGFIVNLGVGFTTRTEVLEWMKANDVPATMFPMGWWAEADPGALLAMRDLRFPIGSHGDQRTELTKLGDDAILADIAAASEAIESVTGEPPIPLFTAYAAATDARVTNVIARAGYLPVVFDVPADDWDYNTTADHVFGKVMTKVKDGSIVEFHLDAPASKESTAVALPWIVERLRKDGYTIVPLTDLMMPCPAGLPDGAPAPVPTSVNG